MFGNAQELMSAKECRPDPELMLQEARKQKDKIDAALSALRDINNSGLYLPGRQNEDEAFRLVGTLTVASWEADKRIERLLKEIDS